MRKRNLIRDHIKKVVDPLGCLGTAKPVPTTGPLVYLGIAKPVFTMSELLGGADEMKKRDSTQNYVGKGAYPTRVPRDYQTVTYYI